MHAFHIGSESTGSLMRFQQVKVDTSIDDAGVASASVRTEKGVTNPLHIVSQGVLGGADLFSRTREETVRGTGSGALDTAVKALHELGDKHGVTGINLSTDASLYGTLQFTDAPGVFTAGQPVIDRIGRDAAEAIDAAARQVLELSKND